MANAIGKITTKLGPFLNRTQRAVPAVGFFGGFLWDAGTLGRKIQSIDLWILFGYWMVAAFLMAFIGYRRHAEIALMQQEIPSPEPITQWAKMVAWVKKNGPTFALQFSFGGLFSALVIFYFKSASSFPSWLMVFFLIVLLIANEFLEDHYHRFTLTLTLFALCGMLFLHFALPHAFKSLNPIWFHMGTALGVTSALGVRRLLPHRPGRIWPIWGLAAFMTLGHFFHWLPPVPLVLKNMVLGTDLKKDSTGWSVCIEDAPWFLPWRGRQTIFSTNFGKPLHFATSVFMPSGIQTHLVHHWEKKNSSGWVSLGRVPFGAQGGREFGYRGNSFKSRLDPGAWRVQVETEDGAIIGRLYFTVDPEKRPLESCKQVFL